ncbi:hypothetical protein PVAP13_7KG284300 [Panicum virgatum]|uniref:ADF-H domain-containing protein n=1 Tax=Panicum virgatum TaxID=38727 RepID=A0A8T0QKK9_PANVG|nr:hypothetical protein PVAP13_7KG284300 [Panicum virgatum]
MDHGWVVVARMLDARAAHGGDVLGQTRPLLRTWRHGRSQTSYISPSSSLSHRPWKSCVRPRHRRRAPPPCHRRARRCGNETFPSTMANSASGMAVNDECKLKFQDLKSKRSFRFITFKIDEHTQQVVVDRLGKPGDTYDDFTASMPDSECRYAVFDFDFTTDENCQKSKIFFISWSPDTSRVRSKMLYASSKDRFKRELDGIQVELQATDPSEMSMDIVKARAL